MIEKGDLFVPDSEIIEVSLLSDPSTGLSDYLMAAEADIFAAEGPLDDTSPLQAESPSQILEEFLGPDNAIEYPLPQPRRFEDMKVEQPILCDNYADELPGSPSVKLNIPADWRWDSSATTLSSGQELMENDLNNYLTAEASKMIQAVEQEKLDAADATARVPVPLLDFSVSPPPWESMRNDAHALFKITRDECPQAFGMTEWSRDRVAEARMLWNPVPSNASRLSINETIEDTTEQLQSFFNACDRSEIPTSKDLVWKNQRLAIVLLEEECADEELEPVFANTAAPDATVPNDIDLVAAVQKRRKLLGIHDEDTGNGSNPREFLDKNPAAALRGLSIPKNEVSSSILAHDSGAHQKALLDSFMELRGIRNPTQSSFFQKQSDIVEPQITTSIQQPRPGRQTINATPNHSGADAPYPTFHCPDGPLKIIVSLTINRRIVQYLKELIPNMILIERDYNAYNASIWIPGSVCRSTRLSPLAHEADLTLSPAMGVVITNMAKIRQKPLPGTSGLSVIRNQVLRIAEKYENLTILVSQGGAPAASEALGDMTSADTSAFCDFQGFLSGLDTTCTAVYVGGAEKTAARWAAWLICQQEQSPQLEDLLLESETYWELWLRRAGMNAYGAQVVAGALTTETSGDAGRKHAQYGLTNFLHTDLVERLAQFEGIFGGRRVLERVSRALDTLWQDPSAGQIVGR